MKQKKKDSEDFSAKDSLLEANIGRENDCIDETVAICYEIVTCDQTVDQLDTREQYQERNDVPSSGNTSVRFAGRINRELFMSIASNVTTDEVIITEERIEHSNRHDNVFEKYGTFVEIVLSSPDIIFRDKRPNTAVLIKRISENGENLELVLRLHVSTDAPGLKNSIISFWNINEARRMRYERNKEIVYKRE